MQIKIEQFLFGKNHSWAVVGKALARELAKSNNVTLVSTDGVNDKYLDKDLAPLIRPKENQYDLQLSYTAMHNFPKYLSSGKKNRFGIWNYEFTDVPAMEIKNYTHCDLFLPSSKFSYDIFLKNKIPAEKMRIVPHGVDFEKFQNANKYPLKINAAIKFFANIAQPHIRKNMPGMLNAWGKAFTDKDDVCLVLKVVDKKPEMSFDQSFSQIFTSFKNKYKNHAKIEVITNYVEKIEELYQATDILFMIPNAECFHFPSLEMLGLGKPVISSNYGGQLDFLNKDNSFLVDGKMIRAPREAHYYVPSNYSEMFEPSIDHAVETLRYCAQNFNSIKPKIDPEIYNRFSWKTVANQILELAK